MESDCLLESLLEEFCETEVLATFIWAASMDRFGELLSEWQNTASVYGFGESSSTGVTEWQNTASVDGFEWLNTPSADGTCAGVTE